MQIIEQMLTGQLPMSEFTQALQKDQALRDTIRHFVPQEAKKDPRHPFWNRITYSVLEQYNFDYLAFVLALTRFDGTIGDALNIFSLFEDTYKYYHPEIVCTTEYYEAHGLYLDAVGSFYEGPEVTQFLNQIVMEELPVKSKSKQIKLLRGKLKEAFHVVDNKRPYWIRGGEWPMGKNSPMQYIGRNKIPDGIEYVFRDVDTDTIRMIEQYY